MLKNKKDPMFDMDNYINKLQRTIDFQQCLIDSLKNEIRTQRKEIGALREERRHFLKDDQAPNFDYNPSSE
jgi:peptidoglycan hydrolase CwlO-like protein